MRQARVACDATRNRRTRNAQRHAGRRGRCGVLRVMRPWQRRCRPQIQDRPRIIAQHPAFGPNSTRLGGRTRNRHHPRRQTGTHLRGHRIILAQHRDVIGPLTREDSSLRSGIAFHVPMAVQVIGAEVQHNSYVEAQSCDSLQHVRRHFEGIDPLRPQYIEIERCGAQIPPHLAGHAGALQNVVDQRSRGGFAIGAGHAHEARLGMAGQHRAIQKLHIAQDGRACRRGRLRRRMGGRQMVRNARGKQQRIGAKGASGGVLQREAGGFGCRAGFGLVVPDRDLGAPGSEAACRR